MDWTQLKEGNFPTKQPNELRILSIDGGGMKGIVPAVYLKQIEQQIGGPIYNFFDMICGTSTGGIIALGLAAGISAKDISELYIKKGEEIFSKSRFNNPVFSAQYSSKNLRALLQKILGDKKIKDAYTMLCVPSIEHHKAEPKVYKTPTIKTITLMKEDLCGKLLWLHQRRHYISLQQKLGSLNAR